MTASIASLPQFSESVNASESSKQAHESQIELIEFLKRLIIRSGFRVEYLGALDFAFFAS